MAKAPAKTETTTDATDKPARVYEAAKLAAIRTDLPVPAGAGRSSRGGRSLYPFDDLEIGGSFAVLNKTAKQMASTVSGANKRHQVDAKDANGNTIFKTQEVKAADGTISHVPTLDPKKVAGRVFVVLDVDPTTDPDAATARVWRKQ